MVSLFRKGHLLEVGGEGFKSGFALTGTSRLMATLANCVQDQLDAEGGTQPPAGQPVAATSNSDENNTSNKGLVTGTGIILGIDGQVLTNNHVIDGCSNIVVQAQGGVPESAAVLFTDATNDLALLKVATRYSSRQVASIRTAPLRAGDPIAVYGTHLPAGYVREHCPG